MHIGGGHVGDVGNLAIEADEETGGCSGVRAMVSATFFRAANCFKADGSDKCTVAFGPVVGVGRISTLADSARPVRSSVAVTSHSPASASLSGRRVAAPVVEKTVALSFPPVTVISTGLYPAGQFGSIQ